MSSWPAEHGPYRPSTDLFGHPRGLTFLFATEMWERFSYYGMRALLVLYMTKYLLLPGHADVIGMTTLRNTLEGMFGPLGVQPFASHIYGLYTAFVYLTPVFGGLIADRLLGQHRTILIGAALMAIGHFMMAFEPLFLLALTILILGNGAFKPNMSAQVGGLYAHGDPRRDRAYSIFYVGINVGALLAPFVCGTLGEEVAWHYGFTAAGVGMLIALAVYLYAVPTLPPDELHRARAEGTDKRPLDRTEWRGVLALVLLFLPVTLFWATYEQQGNTIALWADDYTDRHIDLVVWKGEIPVTWFQAINPVPDHRLHAVCHRAVDLAGTARPRADDHHQDGARLFRRRTRQSHPGRRGIRGGGRFGDLAVAARLFCRDHARRALSFTDRALAGIKGVAGPHRLDDDGSLARHQLLRQSHCRLARQLLEHHGQDAFLSDDRRHRGRRRGRHLVVQLAAQERDRRLSRWIDKSPHSPPNSSSQQ